MSEIITEEIKKALAAPGTLKSVATVDKTGVPHVVYKGSLHLDKDDNFEFYDILEDSKVNENLIYAIWFGKKVSVHILTEDKKSYEFIGHPEKSVTSGREFEKVYEQLLERNPNGGLNAIWTIVPETVREETFAVRLEQSRKDNPILQHLDQFV
jgi:hypothetical protein